VRIRRIRRHFSGLGCGASCRNERCQGTYDLHGAHKLCVGPRKSPSFEVRVFSVSFPRLPNPSQSGHPFRRMPRHVRCPLAVGSRKSPSFEVRVPFHSHGWEDEGSRRDVCVCGEAPGIGRRRGAWCTRAAIATSACVISPLVPTQSGPSRWQPHDDEAAIRCARPLFEHAGRRMEHAPGNKVRGVATSRKTRT
jgi:hypothetical protein